METTKQNALLAEDAYEDRAVSDEPFILGEEEYKVVARSSKISGYQGVLYQNTATKEFIVAYRGTEGKVNDILTDAGMVLFTVNAQAEDAKNFTKQAMQKAVEISGECGVMPQVSTVGHSLGGTLAQYTAHYFDLKGETFNAFGAASLNYRVPQGGSNVVNHVMARDVVGAGGNHFGEVRIYTNQQGIDILKQAGYENKTSVDLRNPLSAATTSMSSSHSISNFTKDGGAIFDSQESKDLTANNALIIDKYRGDVFTARTGVTYNPLMKFGWANIIQSGFNNIRGDLTSGEPAKRNGDVVTANECPFKSKEQIAAEVSGYLKSGSALRNTAESNPNICSVESKEQSSVKGFEQNLDKMLAAHKSGNREEFYQGVSKFANTADGQAVIEDGKAILQQQQQQQQQQSQQQEQEQQQQHQARSLIMR